VLTNHRLCLATVAMAGMLLLPACTGGDGSPRNAIRTEPDANPQPSQIPEQTQPVSSHSALAVALTAVPAAAEVVAFTDLEAAKKRLGYAELTSEALPSRRLEFWEAARVEGSLFTGQRLYDYSSKLALDYGWTAEDVAWEIDFSGSEHACLEDMICDRATGYVVALRRDLDWRSILRSLQDNGFVPGQDDTVWEAPTEGREPFDDLIPIPELNALASGNPIGIERMSDVLDGAPNALDRLAPTVAGLGVVESAYLERTGCVTLERAFGPDATQDDVTAYFKTSDPSELASAEAFGVGIVDDTHARAVLDLGEQGVGPDEIERRSDVIAGWPGIQVDKPFADVASAVVSLEAGFERIELDVFDMATLRAMVFHGDAPWALCPTQAPV